MNSEVCLHLVKERSGILLPGEVSERHFWLLIEISGMHSEKVINALREHLVMGYTAGRPVSSTVFLRGIYQERWFGFSTSVRR